MATRTGAAPVLPNENENGGTSGLDVADTSALEQSVKQVSDALLEAMTASTLQERVDALGAAVRDIEREVYGWRASRRGPDLEAFEGLKAQVAAIQTEWEGLTSTLQSQRERLELLLRSFPGVVEVSAIKALALRVELLEGLVQQLVAERNDAATARVNRRQFVLSLFALGVTVALWAAWFALSFIRG